MTLRNNLDDVDLKILDIISRNARIPFKEVANIKSPGENFLFIPPAAFVSKRLFAPSL
jgi:hypothetical protein